MAETPLCIRLKTVAQKNLSDDYALMMSLPNFCLNFLYLFIPNDFVHRFKQLVAPPIGTLSGLSLSPSDTVTSNIFMLKSYCDYVKCELHVKKLNYSDQLACISYILVGEK